MAYLYVLAWGKYVERPQQEIEERLACAHKEHAPERALWRRSDGTWATYDELRNAKDRRVVQAIVDSYKKKAAEAAAVIEEAGKE